MKCCQGTQERRKITGQYPLLFLKGAKGGVAFHNSIIGHFIVYQDHLETNLLQLFAHPENSDWFSIIFAMIFEVNIVEEQKQAQLATIFLLFLSFHCPQLFYCPPPALPLLRLPFLFF